jgi:hypothetical protein
MQSNDLGSRFLFALLTFCCCQRKINESAKQRLGNANFLSNVLLLTHRCAEGKTLPKS